MKAELPSNESARIKALHDLAILDSPREQSFDDLAQVAAQLCRVPVAVVTLIDSDRQWFKSCIGLDGQETSRDVAFCAHAILSPDELLVVEDATQDPRFADNILVTGEPYIRFYAGAPLVTEEGYALGTLCVVDYQPRQFSESLRSGLKALAHQVMQLLRLRSAYEALQQSSERLQAISDSAPLLIGEIGPNNRYIFINKKYQEWFPGRDFIGKGPREVFSEAVADKIEAAVEECRKRRRATIEILLPGGLELSLSYIANADTHSVYEIAVDITEQKQLEKIKTGFIATVSHELRTPLTSISGALGLVLGNMEQDISEKVKAALTIAYRNSKRLNLLINDLLDMEKLIAGKMDFESQQTSAVELAQQAMTENEIYASKYGVTYRLLNQVGVATINVDSFRLQQVLSNFLSNASKHSPRDGCIDIELSRANGWLRIAVRDYGAGVPEKFHRQIFHKFSQANLSDEREKGGTGLGLAVSRELVERMGGRIGFDKELRTGARFYAEFKEIV